MPIRRSTDVSPALRPAASTALSNDFTPTVSSSAQARVNRVRELLVGHTDRTDEREIIDLFKTASAVELNQMVIALSRKEMHELVSDIDDRLLGPDHKTAFIELISKARVEDLTIEARAVFVQALQYGSTDSLDEKAITDVFLATKGEGLTALKNLIDHGADHRDLQQLVFHDIDSTLLRGQLLAHFKAEAPPKDTRVKVLSDIDDTFYANWTDDRFPAKTIYPGVRALYAELDRGADPQTPDRLGDLMFLSARPYDRAGLAEHLSRELMHENGVTKATVLSGDFAHLIGNQSIADKKFENWEQVNQLYPEYGSVFLGDSGQGDALFAARAAGANADLRAALIHNVTHLDDAGKAEWARKGVFVFDTWVGAAAEAYQRGLISKPGLERVISEATREFNAIAFASPQQRAERQAELDRDIAAARALR